MVTNNHFYNRLNKKIMISLIVIALMYMVFCIVTCLNICGNMDFYKNAKHVSSIVKNIKKENDSSRVIRVSYVVDKKTYVKDIEYDVAELGDVEIGDYVDIFYNSEKPQDAKLTTKTLGSVYITIILLISVGVIFVLFIVYYVLRININTKLLKDNNYVMTKFYRLEFRNSINPLEKNRVNRVYCKAKINDKKMIFKSITFVEKPKPLNDTSMIKVYIDKDNSERYLVDLNDVIDTKSI